MKKAPKAIQKADKQIHDYFSALGKKSWRNKKKRLLTGTLKVK